VHDITLSAMSKPVPRESFGDSTRDPSVRLIDIPHGRVGHRFSRLPNSIRKRLLRPWHCWRFAEFGEGSDVGPRCEIANPRSIAIGNRVQIQRNARIEAHDLRDGKVRIRIGDGSIIAPYVHIGAVESVTIGRNCGIAPFTWITDHDHDTSDPMQPVVTQRRVIAAPTVIEDGVYIGERVAILRGVRIGTGSIIGTNSVVTKDVPPFAVVVGIPARVIKLWDPVARAWDRVGR
jgi:acetyltransferase-like isoleucine patch superfamily enzyme